MDIARGVTYRLRVPPWLAEEAVDEAITAGAEAAKSWDGRGNIHGWVGYKTRFAVLKFVRRELGLLAEPSRVKIGPDWRAQETLLLTLAALRQVLTETELGVMLMTIAGYHPGVIKKRFRLTVPQYNEMLASIRATARNLERQGEDAAAV